MLKFYQCTNHKLSKILHTGSLNCDSKSHTLSPFPGLAWVFSSSPTCCGFLEEFKPPLRSQLFVLHLCVALSVNANNWQTCSRGYNVCYRYNVNRPLVRRCARNCVCQWKKRPPAATGKNKKRALHTALKNSNRVHGSWSLLDFWSFPISGRTKHL